MSALAVVEHLAPSVVGPVIETQSKVALPSHRPGIAADELAELVRSFTEVTERLQTTHQSLQSQVGQLQGELAEANEQLRRTRELAALGEMAAGIAHEVRNPLGSIALDVEMLREDVAQLPESRTICDRVLLAVERLDCIVGDVLRFARDLKVQIVECDPMDVIEIAIAACEAPIRRSGATVERLGSVEGLVAIDRHLLAQAIANLVRNAVEVMAESNSSERLVRIGVRRTRKALPDGRRAEHLSYRVEDTGPGVPEGLVDRIFNPFFTTRSEGTGLGLAIVHRIVDAHGGGITVRNVMSGTGGAIVGARFEIAVPLRSEDRRIESARVRRSAGGLNEAVRRRIGPLAS